MIDHYFFIDASPHFSKEPGEHFDHFEIHSREHSVHDLVRSLFKLSMKLHVAARRACHVALSDELAYDLLY